MENYPSHPFVSGALSLGIKGYFLELVKPFQTASKELSDSG